MLLGNVGLMQAMLGFPDVGKSRGAIQRIFSAIDRQPPIQSYDPNGDTMQQVRVGAHACANLTLYIQ